MRLLNTCRVFVLLAGCIILAACAGTPRRQFQTDPLLLLPEEAEVYFGIIPEQNTLLIDDVLSEVCSEKQSKQIKKILSYTRMVYGAADTATDSLQIIATGEFPVGMLPMVLTGNNGWRKEKQKIPGTTVSQVVYIHSSGMQVTFPSKNVGIVSFSSVKEPLEKYYSSESGSITHTASQWLKDCLDVENPLVIYNYSPENLVAYLFGPKISFGIDTAGLRLHPSESEYRGNLELSLIDPRSRVAALFILKAVALSLSMDKEITVTPVSEDVILLENLTISTDSVIELVGSGIQKTGI